MPPDALREEFQIDVVGLHASESTMGTDANGARSFLMMNGLRSGIERAPPSRKLFVLLVLIALGSTHCAPMTWNDESRMATIQSLVESHTLRIEQSAFAGTGDKVFVGGHFYSDKPPLPALLGAVVYVPLHAMGFELREGPSLSYFLITLLTVSSAWIFGTMALFHALAFTELGADKRLLASLALALGSTFFTWSTTFNNHEMAAGCLSIGFLYLLKGRFEEGRRNLALAGFFFSIAAAADIPTAIFYVTFALYVLLRKELRRKFVFYVLPLLLTALPTALIDYSIHGNILPVQIYQQYFQYPGSPWLGSDELSGMKANGLEFSLSYAFATLFGPKGFLIYNPLLFIAAIGCVTVFREKRTLWPECLCVLLGSLILCSYYWATTTNFGGWSYSIRWFVPLLPLLFYFLHPCLAADGLVGRRIFMPVFAFALCIAVVGAVNPWSPLVYSEVPFVANLRQFMQHLRHPGVIYVKPRPAVTRTCAPDPCGERAARPPS
jgi:4-amino-4-deoxy-L-arabinose transferase-like glycosyltransferase